MQTLSFWRGGEKWRTQLAVQPDLACRPRQSLGLSVITNAGSTTKKSVESLRLLGVVVRRYFEKLALGYNGSRVNGEKWAGSALIRRNSRVIRALFAAAENDFT